MDSKKNKVGGKRKGKRTRKGKQDKNELFKALEIKIGIEREEFDSCYEEFMKICPKGKMTKDQFHDKSKEILGEKAGMMGDALFRVFDEDGSGTMDFEEYIMAINCTNLTEPKEKLTWIFNVFDEDGGGSIDIDEVIKLVIGLFAIGGVEADKEVLLSCVQEILEAIDENNDGEITKEEFVENAMKSNFIRNLIGEGENEDE